MGVLLGRRAGGHSCLGRGFVSAGEYEGLPGSGLMVSLGAILHA